VPIQPAYLHPSTLPFPFPPLSVSHLSSSGPAKRHPTSPPPRNSPSFCPFPRLLSLRGARRVPGWPVGSVGRPPTRRSLLKGRWKGKSVLRFSTGLAFFYIRASQKVVIPAPESISDRCCNYPSGSLENVIGAHNLDSPPRPLHSTFSRWFFFTYLKAFLFLIFKQSNPIYSFGGCRTASCIFLAPAATSSD